MLTKQLKELQTPQRLNELIVNDKKVKSINSYEWWRQLEEVVRLSRPKYVSTSSL